MGTLRKNGSYFDDIDDLDRQIIAIFKANGRASNQKIAQRLGLSAAAVGARVRRLENDRLLKVVLVTDFSVQGYELLLSLGINTLNRDPRTVAQEIAELPQIFSCSLMSGRYNIEALVALPDVDSLQDFIERDLAAIDGIGDVRVEIVVDMLKYEFDVVPFTR